MTKRQVIQAQRAAWALAVQEGRVVKRDETTFTAYLSVIDAIAAVSRLRANGFNAIRVEGGSNG